MALVVTDSTPMEEIADEVIRILQAPEDKDGYGVGNDWDVEGIVRNLLLNPEEFAEIVYTYVLK